MKVSILWAAILIAGLVYQVPELDIIFISHNALEVASF